MSNIYHIVRPHDYILPTSGSAPALTKFTNSTPGSGVVEALSYDATTKEYSYFTFRATQYNPGGTVAVDLDWYGAAGASGVVRWEGAIGALTANVDTEPVPNVGLNQTSIFVNTTLGANSQKLNRSTLTFTGSKLDAMASEDYVTVKISRDNGDVLDTMPGKANVVMTTVYYPASGV